MSLVIFSFESLNEVKLCFAAPFFSLATVLLVASGLMIRRLSLFGSVLRGDFDPRSSDVDVLAEFAPGDLDGVGFRYFGYGDVLSLILGRRVDFCSRLNPYIEEKVRREALPIYEEP